MQSRSEVRAFYTTVGVLLLIPLVAGLVGAFGGVEGMAYLFGVPKASLPPLLANNFRAVCFAFFSWTPLLLWSLAAMPERASVFRIIIICACLTGFARLTGWLVDGYPGDIPIVLMILELGGMPLLLFWHVRLVRLIRNEYAQPGAPADGVKRPLSGKTIKPR